MVQQFTAIEWGTESRPFPRLLRVSLYCGPPGIDRASAGCPGAVREGSHPQQKTRRKLNVRPRST